MGYDERPRGQGGFVGLGEREKRGVQMVCEKVNKGKAVRGGQRGQGPDKMPTQAKKERATANSYEFYENIWMQCE